MAASNESQGLKIAVAVFVTLAVILAVSTYFAYKNYAETDARLAKAEADFRKATLTNNEAATTIEDLRKSIGLKAEVPDEMKTEIKNGYKKVDDEVKSLVEQSIAAVAKAQQAGAQGPELEEAKSRVQQVAAAYQGELNKSYISALSRATELMKNLGLLNNQMSINYTELRARLEGANQANESKTSVVEKAFNDAKTDLAGEQKNHVGERQSLLTKVDQFQTDNARQATEIANLTAKYRQLEDDSNKKLAQSRSTLVALRDRVERKETVLDRPDGHIKFVDYGRNEVQVDLTRSQGARPQMVMTIFDASSPGLPTDKPKGTIELLQVGDRSSVARIQKTNSSIEPFKAGDIVYSAAWSPNDPKRFALIGKIDVNRDGKDDREDLKRMIAAAGGVVDFDLPPPGSGEVSGKLTGKDEWYVIDERPPYHEVYGKSGATPSENADFLKKQTEAIREARLDGVRPMPIERLLPYLGYDMHAPIIGRSEATDKETLRRILAPKPTNRSAAPAAAKPADEAGTSKEETPK